MSIRRSLPLSFLFVFVLFQVSAQSIWLEAECGTWTNQWSLQQDSLSTLVVNLEAGSPSFLDVPSSDASNWLQYEVNAPYTGKFGLYARVKVLDPSSNSVWLRQNNQSWRLWDDIKLSPVPQSAGTGSLPVIPGAQGYGITTPAGRGGQIYTVNNLNDSGPGSLRECVEATGARTCVFEVGGFIDLQSPLAIEDPFITIAGQTAPSPGIILGKGHGIQIYSHDVLVQHISVRPGDQLNGTTLRNRDAMQLNGEAVNKRVHNVVLDHVTMAWGMDENLGMWGYLGDITVRNCIIAQAMRDPFELHGNPSYGHLIGPHDQQSRVSIYGSYYAGNRDRQPLSRSKVLLFANNLLYDRVLRFVYLSNRNHNGSGGFPTNSSIVANAFVEGPDLSYPVPKHKPVEFDLVDQLSTSQVYLSENWWSVQKYSNDWDYIRNAGSSLKTTSPPAWIPGFSYESDPVKIQQHVYEQAGSRPRDRNVLDQQLLDGLVQNSNLVVECVTGCPRAAGPWPNWTPQFRPLDLPANPNGDADQDGYTNLEEWLHAYARSVETGEGDFVWDLATDVGSGGFPIVFKLNSGINTIEFAVREPGLALDKLVLTSDLTEPVGLGLTGFGCDTLVQVDNTFPIELLSFDAIADEQSRQVRLTWTTGRELNNEKFVLERSIDGLMFMPFAELPSQGNGIEIRHYQHFDSQPVLGKSYYRLKQVDHDGGYETFPVIAVNFDPSSGILGRVYPNPVRPGEALKVSVWLGEASQLQFELFNALGQQIWKHTDKMAERGWHDYQFDWSQMPKGIQLLKVSTPGYLEGDFFSQRIWLK